MMWIIICLGNEAKAYGPFLFDYKAKDDLELHMGGQERCPNMIESEDHYIMQLEP